MKFTFFYLYVQVVVDVVIIFVTIYCKKIINDQWLYTFTNVIVYWKLLYFSDVKGPELNVILQDDTGICTINGELVGAGHAISTGKGSVVIYIPSMSVCHFLVLLFIVLCHTRKVISVETTGQIGTKLDQYYL